LMSLKVPAANIMRSVTELRGNRYQLLRDVFTATDLSPLHPSITEAVRSIVVPPGSWCVGKCVDEVRKAGADVAFTGIRRQGILGREPSGDTRFEEGDIVIVFGTPEALEHAEHVLLAG
jgi:CPA2 family monovalent cation:H+ antiporter-2